MLFKIATLYPQTLDEFVKYIYLTTNVIPKINKICVSCTKCHSTQYSIQY